MHRPVTQIPRLTDASSPWISDMPLAFAFNERRRWDDPSGQLARTARPLLDLGTTRLLIPAKQAVARLSRVVVGIRCRCLYRVGRPGHSRRSREFRSTFRLVCDVWIALPVLWSRYRVDCQPEFDSW